MNNEEKILEMLEKMDQRMDRMDHRIEKMDQRMGQMQEQLDRVDERSQRTAVLLETEVTQKLSLLYEGHETIMERLDKLATKDRVGKLEDEIIVLKTAFKVMNQRISELEKAQ